MPITYFYPETYGAVGDGTTDDSAAIQSAIDAAQHVWGVVEFADKVYRCASTLDLRYGCFVLRGTKWGCNASTPYDACETTTQYTNWTDDHGVPPPKNMMSGTLLKFDRCDGFRRSTTSYNRRVHLEDLACASYNTSAELSTGVTAGDSTAVVNVATGRFPDPASVGNYYIRFGMNRTTGLGGETIQVTGINYGTRTLTFGSALRNSYSAGVIVRNRVRPYYGLDFGDPVLYTTASASADNFFKHVGFFGWDIGWDLSWMYMMEMDGCFARGCFEGIRIGAKSTYDASTAAILAGEQHVHVENIERWADPVALGYNYEILIGSWNGSGGETATVTGIDYPGNRLLLQAPVVGNYLSGRPVLTTLEVGTSGHPTTIRHQDLQSNYRCIALYSSGMCRVDNVIAQGFQGPFLYVRPNGQTEVGMASLRGLYLEPGSEPAARILHMDCGESPSGGGLMVSAYDMVIDSTNWNTTGGTQALEFTDAPGSGWGVLNGLWLERIQSNGVNATFPSWVTELKLAGGRYGDITMNTDTVLAYWANATNGHPEPGIAAQLNAWTGELVKDESLPSTTDVAANNMTGTVTFLNYEDTRLVNVGSDPNWQNEPDGNYDVILTLQEVTDGPAADGAYIVDSVTGKTTTGFRINLRAAPGGSAQVRYRWLLVR